MTSPGIGLCIELERAHCILDQLATTIYHPKLARAHMAFMQSVISMYQAVELWISLLRAESLGVSLDGLQSMSDVVRTCNGSCANVPIRSRMP